MGIKILETGRFIPEKVMTNEDFSQYLETSDEWITTRTGMKNRHIVEDEEVSFMALEVAKKLLKDHKDIKILLVACFTQDYLLPSVAAYIHEQLELPEDMLAADVNSACTGFIACLQLAHNYIKKGEKACVIAVEALSKYVDYSDRSTAILFGDGGAGVVFEKDDRPYAADIGTRGNSVDLLLKQTKDRKDHSNIFMEGQSVYRFATSVVPKSVEKTLQRARICIDDVDLFVFHQANMRILKNISTKLKIPFDKFYVNLEEYGNTSAVSIAICLSELADQGVKEGSIVLLSGFGAGLTWGSILFQW